jgi:serine/threonine-protein kinase RsbW
VTETLSLYSEPAELERLIGFAEAFARDHGLPAPEQVRLLIMLEELFANAVEHGYDGPTPAGRIDVALGFDGTQLTITFSDDGRPFEPLAGSLPDLAQPAEIRRIGGLGLHILRSLVDGARYCRESGRNHLVLTRRLAGGRWDDQSR